MGSNDLLPRLERAVRRFGGPLPIDDLLPELDAESSVYLSSEATSEETASGEATTLKAEVAAGWRELEIPTSVEADSVEAEEPEREAPLSR